MKKFTRQDILKIANEIHFVVREDVLDELEKFFNDQLSEITKKLNTIDTTHVAPMSHVDPTPQSTLRIDEPDGSELAWNVIAKNAQKTAAHHISLPQAVKDD